MILYRTEVFGKVSKVSYGYDERTIVTSGWVLIKQSIWRRLFSILAAPLGIFCKDSIYIDFDIQQTLPTASYTEHKQRILNQAQVDRHDAVSFLFNYENYKEEAIKIQERLLDYRKRVKYGK